MEEHVRLQEVADQVGLSVRALRAFDRAGLVRPVAGAGGSSGLYGDHEIERLRLVKRLEPLDLPLEDLGEVLDAIEELAEDGTSPQRRRELLERLGHATALAEERAARLRDEVAAVDAVTAELRWVVLRGRLRRDRT